ncbi:hypothetical protein PybrP1_008318, partial [[Pythium] brassicae (nom. inval.)]
VRAGHFFAAIGIYALAFVAYGAFSNSGSDSGLGALFRSSYDAKLNRILALLSPQANKTQAASDAAAGYECVGWRHTMDCDPNSDVLQSFNRSCDHQVRGGDAGYCAVKSRATGHELRVMRQSCGSVRPEALFTCSLALDFVQFRLETDAAVASARAADSAALANASSVDAPDGTSRGIVMVVYPKLLVSTYAVVRTLRESLNCSLPIEIWYLASEMGGNATSNAVLRALVSDFAPLSLVAVADPDVTGFNSKVHAILHTNLSDVLFLDADNVPVRDPTYLFDNPEYERTDHQRSKFCGMSMAQFDPAGDIVFLHRNAMKLNGGRPALGKDPDAEMWTHLQTFVWGANKSASVNAIIDAAVVAVLVAAAPTNRTAAHELLKEFYRVTIYSGAPEFPASQSCYGQPSPQLEANWRTIPWSETQLEGVEKKLLRFAKEGAALLPAENVIMVST